MIDNITFALALVFNVSLNDYCMHEVGCFRFNCADFTYQAVTILRANNFTAYPMLGWYGHSYHAWVGLEMNGILYYIEPQSGEIVYHNSTHYKYGRRGIVRGLH